MTTLTVAVVAHPKRLDQAQALAETLDAHLVLDDAGYGEQVNHARAWEWAAEQDASHALVIEDDAVPVENLRGRLIEVIESLPHDGLLLAYTGSDRREKVARRTLDAHRIAEVQGRRYIALRDAHWGVGIAARTAHAGDIARALRETTAPSDDTIGLWARTPPRIHIYATHPNLLEHADGPSVIPGNGTAGPRRALWLR